MATPVTSSDPAELELDLAGEGPVRLARPGIGGMTGREVGDGQLEVRAGVEHLG